MSRLKGPHCGGKMVTFGRGGTDRKAQAEAFAFLCAIPTFPENVTKGNSGWAYDFVVEAQEVILGVAERAWGSLKGG